MVVKNPCKLISGNMAQINDQDRELIELAQEFLSFDIGIENAKIIYKLEKDNGKTIKIKDFDTYDHVKITTKGGHTIDNNILRPSVYCASQDPSGDDLLYSIRHNNFSKLYYDERKHNINVLDSTFLTARDGVFKSDHISSIEIKSHNILTTDGKPIDAIHYTSGKKLQLVKGAQIPGTMCYAIDLYDYDNNGRGSKVGTLPTKFLGIFNNQVKLVSYEGSNTFQSSNLSGYFTLKYTQNGVVGYFSDEHGIQDITVIDEFKINISIEDFMSNAKDELVSLIVEELLSAGELELILGQEIAHKLAHNTRFKRSVKGDDGDQGQRGTPGVQGPEGPQGLRGEKGEDGEQGPVGPQGNTGPVGPNGTGKDARPEDVAKLLKADEKFKEDVRGEDANSAEIAHRLVHSSRFKRSVKGDDGEPGEQGLVGLKGDPGKDGTPGIQGLQGLKGDPGKDGTPGDQGLQGIQGPRGYTGSTGPAGNDGASGQRGKDGAPGEKGEKGDAGSQGHEGRPGSEGEKGEDGAPGPRGRDGKHGKSNADAIHNLLEDLLEDGTESFTLDHRSRRSTKKFQLKVVPGESYNDNKKEANIKLEVDGKSVVIATFLEIGYFFKDDDLYIRDHITGNNILIPKIFHFLKVVEDGLNSYKLAFCNNLGNSFFDHKKYDQEYADLSEEHKLINLKYMKNAANIDLSKYYYHHAHIPLFVVKQGELEWQSTEIYRADVYEIERNEKIGTLIDEFGFFDDDKFHHIDHHQGYDSNFQDLNVRIEDHKGNFQIENNTIHPITLDDGLLGYLGYQFN